MALLSEYAIVPDVFDVACHASEDVCVLQLQILREVMLHEGLVRDLRGGAWSRLLSSDGRTWQRRTKELVKKLATQNRLCSCGPSALGDPTSDQAWCHEALATHATVPLDGIIACDAVAAAFPAQPLVASVNRLPATPWWTRRSPSFRLKRTIAEYVSALKLVFGYANSIQFIDPHLYPGIRGYTNFDAILAAFGARSPAPRIEIHRCCFDGGGPGRQILHLPTVEADFRRQLQGVLRASKLAVEVFLWDEFHDRYLISDLIGVLLANGFDTTANPRVITTWTRLGRDDRDAVQREFDPASSVHALRGRFTIS